MLVGKPYMHSTISQGLFFFVRHAPLPISPLCCLILRRGFRVYLQGKTKTHKYWYHLFTNWNPSNLQTTGSEFQNGIEPDVGVSFESGTERSEKIAREESRPFSFFFTIFITFRWWIYGFLILFSALPFSHLSLSISLLSTSLDLKSPISIAEIRPLGLVDISQCFFCCGKNGPYQVSW